MNRKKSKVRITTKIGDHGYTKMFSGETVSKNSLRMEALGDLDELSSILGIALNHLRRKNTRSLIRRIQKDLLLVSAEVATSTKTKKRLRQMVDDQFLADLEERIIIISQKVNLKKEFILPGLGFASATLDYARAVARRCERKSVGLYQKKELNNPTMIVWLNRLSDYLFLLARVEEKKSKNK